jgi:hypothetical protein
MPTGCLSFTEPLPRNIEAIRQALQKLIGIDLFAAEIYFFTPILARIDAGAARRGRRHGSHCRLWLWFLSI